MKPRSQLSPNVRALISHRNCPTNIENTIWCVTGEVTSMTWLPQQYHELGLVCGMILPFAACGKCNMFSPIEFIKNPLLCDLMSRLLHVVTQSHAPNFAYRFAAQKFIEANARSAAKREEPISELLFSHPNAFIGRSSTTFNIIVKFLGVQIGGHALCLPHLMYEYSYITTILADRTILDGSHITGHYVVHNDITTGPCKVSGVLHEGPYAANPLITEIESDSLRTFVGLHKLCRLYNKTS